MHASFLIAILLAFVAGALTVGSHVHVETLVVALLGVLALGLARNHLRR
jgi:hypothetical protein